jgi:hypothetical protein
MTDVPHLRPVQVDVSQDKSVDCWLIPEDLPTDIFVVMRRPAIREWRFDLDKIMLLRTTLVNLSELVEMYRDYSMGYHHLSWFLKNQSEIPQS